MRLFEAVVMIAGMVWMVGGCGGAVTPLVKGGVVLADSVTQTRYSLGISNGSAVLTSMSGDATAMSDPELVDGVTGARYSLGVVSGALTLWPDTSSGIGATQIGLADTVTTKTYELAVANGALTLTPSAGGAQ